MEKVLVKMFKLTKAEAAALPNGTPFIVFNPEFRYRQVEISNPRSIAKSQYEYLANNARYSFSTSEKLRTL